MERSRQGINNEPHFFEANKRAALFQLGKQSQLEDYWISAA